MIAACTAPETPEAAPRDKALCAVAREREFGASFLVGWEAPPGGRDRLPAVALRPPAPPGISRPRSRLARGRAASSAADFPSPMLREIRARPRPLGLGFSRRAIATTSGSRAPRRRGSRRTRDAIELRGVPRSLRRHGPARVVRGSARRREGGRAGSLRPQRPGRTLVSAGARIRSCAARILLHTGALAHGESLIDQIGPRGPRIAALVRWLEAADVDVTKASESTTGRIYNAGRVRFRGDRETSQRAFRIATDLGCSPRNLTVWTRA
jgi:hypothetical protein